MFSNHGVVVAEFQEKLRKSSSIADNCQNIDEQRLNYMQQSENCQRLTEAYKDAEQHFTRTWLIDLHCSLATSKNFF